MRFRSLDRYVMREFLRLFTLFALAAPVLFILGDLMDNLDKYMSRGLAAQRVALSYLYQLPLFVLYSFPIAALIAAVFTVNNMTRHSEVTAAKAGGISFFRLFAMLPLLGVVLTAGGLALSELVPVTNRMREEVLGQRPNRFRQSRTDFAYRAGDGRVFSIRRLDVGIHRMEGIVMERKGNEPEVPSEYLVAEEANFDPTRGWTLRNGHLRLFMGAGVERALQFERVTIRSLVESPEDLLADAKDPDNMRYAELGQFIEIIERSGGRPLKLMVQKAQKVAIPVATLVIVLFAMPLATSAQRGGSAFGVGVSLAITMLYLMLFKVAGAAGASGALPPLAAAWLPNALFAVAAGVLMVRVRS